MLRSLSPMLVLCALALAACSSGKPHARLQGALLPPGVRAHPFTLTDQHGRAVSLESFHGQVRLLAFLSASQRGSLLVAQQIRGALDELDQRATGKQVITLIVATDAATARAAIRRFLAQAALGGRALYLTGPPALLRTLWHAYGVVPASAGEAAFLQSTPILLVDRAGLERVGFPVEQLTPETLAHDLRALLRG